MLFYCPQAAIWGTGALLQFPPWPSNLGNELVSGFPPIFPLGKLWPWRGVLPGVVMLQRCRPRSRIAYWTNFLMIGDPTSSRPPVDVDVYAVVYVG